VDTATILHRRELLSAEVHATYEQGFPVDQRAFEGLRQEPLEQTAQTDAVQSEPVMPARKAG